MWVELEVEFEGGSCVDEDLRDKRSWRWEGGKERRMGRTLHGSKSRMGERDGEVEHHVGGKKGEGGPPLTEIRLMSRSV